MNNGLFSGFGSGTRGVLRPCVWQVYEVTTASIPFVANAQFLSFIVIGGGAGGGGGRFGLSTAASGGGGGAGCGAAVQKRIPVSILRAFNVNVLSITIGAGGTGGAGGATDGTNGSNGTNGGTSTISFDRIQMGSTGSPESMPYQLKHDATGASAGGGGTTATGSGGSTSTQFPYMGFGGMTGGSGNTTAGNGAITQTIFPSNRGAGGGAGGSGKGTGQGVRLEFPISFGQMGNTPNPTSRGLAGLDAEQFARQQQNALLSLARFPDMLELIHYMPVGGGGGQGGDTTANTAGGNGGLGWHGSGGGGGGGASGGSGGTGGNGGSGVAILCWEFE